MKTIRSIVALLAVLALTSCEKEIEFNGTITEPLVVVNSYLIPDSTIRVMLSKSRFLLDSNEDFERVNTATVSIVVNNQYKETLQFIEKGLYTGTYKPQPGDSVALLVRVPGKDDIRSSAILPSRANIQSVDTISRKLVSRIAVHYSDEGVSAWMSEYDLEMGIRIKDPAVEKNFYRLSILYNEVFEKDTNQIVNKYYVDFNIQGVSNETSGSSLISLIGGEEQKEFQVFSDELFDGKDIVIRFKMKQYLFEIPEGYENPTPTNISYLVNLQSLSHPSYLYVKTKEASEDVVNELFSEPVQIYSNIENGIGIFGALTNNKWVVR